MRDLFFSKHWKRSYLAELDHDVSTTIRTGDVGLWILKCCVNLIYLVASLMSVSI